jgi:hypothetical protein
MRVKDEEGSGRGSFYGIILSGGGTEENNE